MNKNQYYSQFGEDKILNGIFKGANDGFCIEIGANDGIADSNTYFFENLGWTCLLVEPNPVLCKNIRLNRIAKLFECAVTSISGSTTLYIATGSDRAHGVSAIGDEKEITQKIESYGFKVKPIEVKTKTLDQILHEANISRTINFLTIDVEGQELSVLEGFSIEKWRPEIVLIEDNSNFSDIRVDNYMRLHKYRPFFSTGVNVWYAQSNDSRFVNSKTWLVTSVQRLLKKIMHSEIVWIKRFVRLVKVIPGAKLAMMYLASRRPF